MAYRKSFFGSFIGYIAAAIGSLSTFLFAPTESNSHNSLLSAFRMITRVVSDCFTFKGDADTHLALDNAARSHLARSSNGRPFVAFIERAKTHMRFVGSGFVDPGNAYA